jgi:hypothetical protein
LGAVTVEARAHALPADEETHEDFHLAPPVDFFRAETHATAEGLVCGGKTALQQEDEAVIDTKPLAPPTGALKNRTWVTRQGVQVDRIASAWLIRRFIDEGSRFKFVTGKGYAPASGELRFDMFDGEFTHQGDRCTFEVLIGHIRRNDPALVAIGEIIHDIDLRDDKYGREEAASVRSLIAGIAASSLDDERRLARGAVLLDDLYRSFADKQGNLHTARTVQRGELQSYALYHAARRARAKAVGRFLIVIVQAIRRVCRAWRRI